MKVIISIVSFNTKNLVENCLRSILSEKYKNDVGVWVIDNASSDGTIEMLKKKFPDVKFLINDKNLGFGAAHNRVFKKIDADYYLVLNPDTLFEENPVDKMITFMEQEECAIASCKIFGFDGNLQPNAGDLPFGISLINWLFNLEAIGIKSSFHRNEPSFYETSHEVGWVSGNFMMIKGSVFKKIRYFDEEYFMYFEDTELCFRAKQGGLKIMINPKTYIKHLSGGSLDDPKLRQWSGEYNGLVRFYFKNFGIFAGVGVKFLSYLSILFRIIAFTIVGKLNISLTYGKIIFKF